MEIVSQISKSGGQVILNYLPDNTDRFGGGADIMNNSTEEQLKWFPEKYMKGLVDEMDHYLYIIAEENPRALSKVDPKKNMLRQNAMRKFMEWRSEKENAGKLSWTLCLYPTAGMAKEAKMNLKQYWEQVINACFLDKKDPIAEWKKTYAMMNTYKEKLNKLSESVDYFHMTGKDCDIKITLGENRSWVTGSGRNVPTFEVFTSPDWRGTNGWIRFNQPLYRYGTLIEDVYLEFKDGKVVKATSKKGEKVLKEMISSENADKIGEYSLTDSRCSRITKFMANTLYDENVGGKEGNTHIALGNSYTNTCNLDITKMSREDFEKLGYNYSPVHTDIISTTKRQVVAKMKDGSEVLIYKDGKFVV
jgi:aminopeptidase